MANTTATKKRESQETKSSSGTMARRPEENRPATMSRTRDEFDRWFNRIARDFPTPWDIGSNSWSWGVELEEKDDELVVKAEAPGFEQDDFDIRVQDNRLIMKASRSMSSKDKEGASSEECECYQSISLPCDVDQDKANATYRNGVLTVMLPKMPEAKGRKIPVQGSERT